MPDFRASICENPFGLVLRLVWKPLLFRRRLKTLKTLIDIDVEGRLLEPLDVGHLYPLTATVPVSPVFS